MHTYLGELARRVRDVITAIEAVFAAVAAGPAKRDFLQVSAKTHSSILDALNSAARVSALLWPVVGAARNAALARARGIALCTMLGITPSEFPEFQNKSARNSVEHFDERLDQYLLETLDEVATGRSLMLPLDMVISSDRVLETLLRDQRLERGHDLRIYNHSTRTFTNTDGKTRLDKLLDEAKLLWGKLPKLERDHVDGGAMIILAPAPSGAPSR